MKKSFKKYLSLVMVLMVAFVCLFSVSVKAESEDDATFDLGTNGSASHYDGSEMKTAVSYTVGDYKLTITPATKTYSGARDAKGNSCLKLGTSSAVGKFSFTVPNDVTSVIIYAAKYKTNTTKINVNGTAYNLTKNSVVKLLSLGNPRGALIWHLSEFNDEIFKLNNSLSSL